MDGTDVIADPHNEVRKLQELVKKLEKQNEVLRNKTPGTTDNKTESSAVNNHITGPGQVNGNISENEQVKIKPREQLRLADLEDVDYQNLPADEGCWLYTPSNNDSWSEESLISWMRQDFDNPTPERESSKNALVHFIEEAARMKHSSSSPMLGGQPLSSKSASALSKSAEDNRSIAPPSSRLASLQRAGIPSAGAGKGFDTNTFTRPKRPANSAIKGPFHGEGDQVQNVPNAADIENLAKQQEESLRQSVTPAKNNLRSKHPLVEGDPGARTSPSRFDVEGSYMAQHRGSFSSDQSTPPDSPHNSQHFQLNPNAMNDGRVRRPLQPGSGLQYRSHNSSDSSLERHSVDTNGSDEVNLAPEAMRAPASRLQPPRNNSTSSLPKRGLSGLAPGLAKPQQRGVSPQRQSGLPTARRQIARPSTAPRSSLPQFRRPVTPSSRTAPTQSQDEASWRDGCF